jgi:hypothetical protein
MQGLGLVDNLKSGLGEGEKLRAGVAELLAVQVVG